MNEDFHSSAGESARWKCAWRIDKYQGDFSGRDIDVGQAGTPLETIEREGNLLMTQGASDMWMALTGGAITAYSAGNATIGVGDSAVGENTSQTDLQAASNKVRIGMDTTYPLLAGNQCVLRATFGSSTANFTWAEWGVFNAGSGGHMLNRKVAANGVKALGSTWQLTVTLSLT